MGVSRLGALPNKDGSCGFLLFAPDARKVEVEVMSPCSARAALASDGKGYFGGTIGGVSEGARYFFVVDGDRRRPDPASRFQPEGVHRSSAVVNASFPWSARDWRGRLLKEYVIYEIHVGLFSSPGTFDGVIEELPRLADLGVTAVELMPIAQFPGARNWGYDGVHPFAAQNTYGGPDGFRRMVDACHAHGLSVVLDVVYNHLGPEGNYLADFGPYFTDRYRTPWGAAVNFDGPLCDDVRRFFIESAIWWLDDCRVDALRIDAVHGILDFSARTFLEDLSVSVEELVRRTGRNIYLIAESDLNDSKLLRPRSEFGYGLDAQWNDDFHHALHTLLTGERRGYYEDFGCINDLVTAIQEGFVYSGRFSWFRRRRHGISSSAIEPGRLVVFSQNHDQVGNRMAGDRLSALVPFEALKLAAGAVVLSPNLPLLFMGEEYGEKAPFPYFIDHTDTALVEAVRKGRREEFASFGWGEGVCDPASLETYVSARLNPSLRTEPQGRCIEDLYRRLLTLRRSKPQFAALTREGLRVRGDESLKSVWMSRSLESEEALILLHFGTDALVTEIPFAGESWSKLLDSADTAFGGPGSKVPGMWRRGDEPFMIAPLSFVVWERG